MARPKTAQPTHSLRKLAVVVATAVSGMSVYAQAADKPKEEQLIFIKSWNEWGEGNYMEPDLEFGKGYLTALSEALEENRPNP